jgi:dTDP-glucose 4,6-dehydratase
MRDTILVTGGAGFIGSNFVLSWMESVGSPVVNLDLLTYAGNPANLSSLENDPRYLLARRHLRRGACRLPAAGASAPGDCALCGGEPRGSLHCFSGAFIRTNVQGTFVLLEQAKAYWSELSEPIGRVSIPARLHRRSLRLARGGTIRLSPRLRPTPNSPYAASKAASDHLARAYYHTWGLPVLTTNCSNNYGPFQFPEKLIPLMILKRAGGQGAAGLRRWNERARLAVCRRPLRRSVSFCARPDRGDLQHRRKQRADEYRGGTDLRSCGRDASRLRPPARGGI